MRKFVAIALLCALAGGCGSQTPGEEAPPPPLDANRMTSEPGNDASAMEAVAAETDPVLVPMPDSNAAGPSNAAAPGPLGETDGGDTGGNVTD